MNPQDPDPLGRLRGVSVAMRGETVAWIGPTDRAPRAAHVIDATGAIVMPGLVDCHTHAIWAGTRADEFQARLAGASYSDILEGGGGILSTVRRTRDAPDDVLLQLAVQRIRRAIHHGVTTLEIKSGYGLSPEHEARLLRIAKRAGEITGVTLCTTFLGGHTVPMELRDQRSTYVTQIIDEQLPMVADIADGRYDPAIREVMAMDPEGEAIRKLYTEREQEPVMADESWRPKSNVGL